MKCEVGQSRMARHDSLRDWHLGSHKALTGFTTNKEQRVPPWDRVNPRNGEIEEAKLDVATRDAVTQRPIYVDWSVTCEHSTYEPRRVGRVNNDGVAASQQVDEKRDRYPPHGGELVPMVFETGGRPSDEALSFVRCYGHGLETAERSAVISRTWRQISRTLQNGNAEMILSAVG